MPQAAHKSDPVTPVAMRFGDDGLSLAWFQTPSKPNLDHKRPAPGFAQDPLGDSKATAPPVLAAEKEQEETIRTASGTPGSDYDFAC